MLNRLRRANGRGALLYVDQLEELVTIADTAEAALVSELLAQLGAGVPGCRVVASARSDFLTRLAGLPGLYEAISGALYLLRPLGAEDVREVIVGPARMKAVEFESDEMVQALAQSTLATDGGLPLLQFALQELWERRDVEAQVIRTEALRAMGGVEGALARHADVTLGALLPDARQQARRILLRLISNDTSARRTEEELVGDRRDAHIALEALIRARLVVARQTEAGTTYNLAHEALLRGWGTLARWLQEDRQLQLAAAEWERLGRAKKATWSREQLAEIAGLDTSELSPRERAFLDASRRMSSRRRLVWARALAASFVVAVGGTYGGVKLRAQYRLAAQVAEQLGQVDATLQVARAERARADEARARAFAAFDNARLAEGNEAWADAVVQEPRIEAGYAAALDALARASVLDPSREDVRAQFVDVLDERAELAEQRLRFAERDELVQRLKLYDPAGISARRWTAPLRLAIQTDPSGAEVSVARYVSGADGMSLEPARVLGKTPREAVELERGSYLLTFTAAGRAPVRYPLLADGWTERTVEVQLPAAEDVPPGFVRVPAGTFLFGTAADEDLREFFHTVPLHPVETAAYDIGIHEVTFGEYLEYLRSLPPAERARRAPRPMGRVGMTVSLPAVELAPTADGRWRLRITPGSVALSALEGEPVRYPGRKANAEQDWRKMPVGSIDFDDARAYAAWLDRTGRVRGARLCTEWEWERAARGADARVYPHGDRLRREDANFDVTYGKVDDNFGPDEVGLHPRSRSPFGLDDLVGNVWEWVEPSLERDVPIARGGSYSFDTSSSRVENRERPDPSFRDLSVGFRICADAPR